MTLANYTIASFREGSKMTVHIYGLSTEHVTVGGRGQRKRMPRQTVTRKFFFAFGELKDPRREGTAPERLGIAACQVLSRCKISRPSNGGIYVQADSHTRPNK